MKGLENRQGGTVNGTVQFRPSRSRPAPGVIDGARSPGECGPDIVDAPARGEVVLWRPVEMAPVGEDGWEAREAGWRGRAAMRRADVFDRMWDRAARQGRAMALSIEQVEAGRAYAGLVERLSAAGVGCQRWDDVGGGGGAWIDAVIADRRRLERMRGQLAGVALAVSRRGRGRIDVRVRDLVDLVCVEDRDMSGVLRAHGWAAKGAHRRVLTEALGAALDKMRNVGG